MKKIPLGTKIIVTTAGLVAMAGIFYAANPRPVVTVNTTDHTGITFDHEGTFGFNMIVTSENGVVLQVDNLPVPSPAPTPPHVTVIARTGIELEGPAVVPREFGPYGGQILAADENNGAVHAIDSGGNITYNVFDWSGAEGVVVIPSVPCASF